MNRFKYVDPILFDGEETRAVENNVKLYDGDQKTSFEGGELIITTHRILWGRPGAIARGQTCLALPLSLIVFTEEESPGAFSFSRSKKIVLHLSESADPSNGPQMTSIYNHVKLSFKDGFSNNVTEILQNVLQQRSWEAPSVPGTSQRKPQQRNIALRSGILGIERSLLEKQKATDESIVTAFQDLNNLMGMAKDMVALSKTISTKIRERQGDITEDETVHFKSYLMSLGIDDPVTRDSHKSNDQYYRGLAKEISDFLAPQIEEVGGMMALTDVFCRMNRARSLELLSPEDILNACKLMETLGLPLKLYEFSSGVKVLQLSCLDKESVAETTAVLVEEKGSLSAEELSQNLGISLTLAKERLHIAEELGKCCRDDAFEGLRFFPNLLLTKEDSYSL